MCRLTRCPPSFSSLPPSIPPLFFLLPSHTHSHPLYAPPPTRLACFLTVSYRRHGAVPSPLLLFRILICFPSPFSRFFRPLHTHTHLLGPQPLYYAVGGAAPLPIVTPLPLAPFRPFLARSPPFFFPSSSPHSTASVHTWWPPSFDPTRCLRPQVAPLHPLHRLRSNLASFSPFFLLSPSTRTPHPTRGSGSPSASRHGL